MDIAVLIKQVPAPESLELGPDGRLVRTGVELEMNAYCRRAVTTGARLAKETGGRSVAITLGPPSAEDALREAVAWGVDEGILVTDPALAGSDTIATARALAAVLALVGPFDLVLAGRNSIDADTGQVPPQVAELLDLPFAPGVRSLELDGSSVRVRSELDDGGGTPWSRCRPCCRRPSGCASRPRSPRPAEPRCRPSASARWTPPTSGPARGVRRPAGPWSARSACSK